MMPVAKNARPAVAQLPLLYTFRRCPYAIRARLAIAVSDVQVKEIEVALNAKPEAMLAISPKGTVPVLQLADGRVLEQSLDIMRWALMQHDPENWLKVDESIAHPLISQNDTMFKRALDRYKYPERFPEKSQAAHREDGEAFLRVLEVQLGQHAFLAGERQSYVDAAIMPFVRQFAAVDTAWWGLMPCRYLRTWLSAMIATPVFLAAMAKR
jgi:glutathione S-transferase